MPWIIDEATKRALEYFKDHEEVEMVLRHLKGEYAPFENLKLKWVDEVKEKVVDQDTIRNIVRNMNKNTKKLDQIIPKLDQIFKPLQNVQILSILNTALSAANLVATVAGMVIICNKLNKIDYKLDEIKQEIAAVKNIDFEMLIRKPCRQIVDDYKFLVPDLSKDKPVPEEKLIKLIRECKDYIISLYTLRNDLPLDAVLNLIFMLLPILTNCMIVYYKRFFDPNQKVDPLYDSCMPVFDMLSDPDFIDQIQDYMFIEMKQDNRSVNEYLDCQRLIVYSYRKQIEQLLADLKTCGSKEGYEDAMLWTRQYVAQQARVVQAELESKIGPEKAKEYVEQVMQETGIL